MQSDRDALLAGILADPDADLPRLVFADWLEETGHPANCARAEYIRLAIEFANYKHRGRMIPKHMKRLNVLKSMFEDEWDECEQATNGRGHPQGIRHRGFVEEVIIPPESLIGAFAYLPQMPVRSILISGYGSFDAGLLRLPRLPWLNRFAICLAEAGRVAVDLLSGTETPRLLEVQLVSCGISDGDIVRLVSVFQHMAPQRNLQTLNLRNSWLTDHAAHTIAAADWPPSFRSLNIDGTHITNAGREVLYRRFGFEELRPRLALS